MPQAVTKPTSAPDPAQMSSGFSKAALRALLAIGDESETMVHSYINDASVEAQTPTELKAAGDLHIVDTIMVVNGYREYDRRRDIQTAYQDEPQGSSVTKEHTLDWFLQNDPVLQGMLKLDRTCHDALETVLRARVYQPLPAECKMPTKP